MVYIVYICIMRKTKVIPIRIDIELLNKFETKALKLNRSRNWIINEHLKKIKK